MKNFTPAEIREIESIVAWAIGGIVVLWLMLIMLKSI
jgi:hypothetical protein